MIRIALCDDNELELTEIQHFIEQYLNDQDFVNLYTYTTSTQLAWDIDDDTQADIYILDVDMPKIDGFTLADQILQKQPSAILIFLTAHSEYATRGYRYQALRYIHKLRMQEELGEALDTALDKLQYMQKTYITLKFGSNYNRIALDDILYVCRVARVLEIHTVSMGVIQDTHGIKELFDMLKDRRYVFIDRSCFINSDYIRHISNMDVTLTNGDQLPISRRMMANLKSHIAKEWNV